MKKTREVLCTIGLIFIAVLNPVFSQENFKLNPMYAYVFDPDSLQGFEEDAARRSAISESYLGKEFVGRMYVLKRSYINDKYNLWPKQKPALNYTFNAASKVTVVPGCTNEDFEASTADSVSTPNQIAGWTITRGNVIFPNDACNLNGCCPHNPIESELFDVPNGYIDPVIGSCYPIFSVFGTSAGNPNAEANNPQISQPMLGDKFIRINSSGLTWQTFSIEKLSKTFAVTANNALFQFAFIFVTATGHSCCSAGAFQIKLTNATTNSLIACPSYSTTGPTSSCMNYTVNGINFLVPATCATAALNSAVVFNKWRISSMDLSAYIGQNITIDVIVSDCDQGAHYGYAYFDAQCGPLVVYGNNVAYGAGSGSINVPTCGTTGATLCASAGLGPYWWAGPGVPSNYATPSQTNNCYVTAISGQYTLYMNPVGSCAPIERVINVTITPSPILLSGVTQAVCGSTTAIVTVTPSGSVAGPSASIVWSPNPLTINGSSTQATYVIPVGPAPLIVTITAMDANGCSINAYANVNPPPPIPTFTPVFITPSASLTCTNYTVTLGASTSYTYGSLVYNWTGISSSYTGATMDVTFPGTYTVCAMDPVSLCSAACTVITVGVNTVSPTATLQPTYQSITCLNPAIQTVTTTANSPTINVEHQFYFNNGLNVTGVYSNSAIIIPPPSGPTGTHTYVIVNLINGCKSTINFSVATSGGFPTYTITSPVQNFSVGCAPEKHVADIVIANSQSDPIGLPLTYTILTPGASTNYATGSATSYTFTQPGTYAVVVKDQTSGCESISPFSIIQNTFAPQIAVAIPNHTLSCAIPTVQLTGSSTNPSKSYRWLYGTSGVEPGATFTVNTAPPASNLLIGNYVFEVKDLNNTCISQQTVPIYQNIFPPIAKISGPSGANTEAVSCKIPSLTLNNSQTTWGSGGNFPTPQGVASIQWMGPSPQPTVYNSPSYLAIQPGTYTMTAMDLNNGCTSTTVFVVTDNRDYPVVQNPVPLPPDTLDCGNEFARVEAAVSTTVGLNYEWFNPAGSIKQGNVGATGLPNPFALVNDTGVYRIVVTNTINGCVTEAEGRVVLGQLNMAFTSDKISGYAPLTVVFNNQTTSGAQNTSSIVSLWSFGNGNTQTVSAANYTMPITQVYQQPGQYTVTLYTSKGKTDGKNTCIDSTFRIISVDIPSKLEIPNVFTPNGDGSNDLFFVRMANLSSIKFTVYDRWGNLVYELENSNNGNIEWNGKNQFGKDVAEGTYFYIVTATGKDGKAYDTKGTVNLFR